MEGMFSWWRSCRGAQSQTRLCILGPTRCQHPLPFHLRDEHKPLPKNLHRPRTSTVQDAASSEAKATAEGHPNESSHHPQGLDKTGYRVLQILRQYVRLVQPTYQGHATQPLASRILFQRGVYPSDDFQMVKKYGQTVLITQDAALEAYLDKFVSARL